MEYSDVRGLRPRPKLEEIGFVVTEYRPESDRPVAALPKFCPYLEEDPGEPCSVRFHHLRRRTTGPAPAIVVCECSTHGKCFGLYPPGGVPYARVRWCPVGPGGEALQIVEDAAPPGADEELTATLTAYLPTYPGAAVDEGRGVLWPTGCSWGGLPGNTHLRRETQVRRSLRTLRVVGVDGSEVEESDRLGLSELLGIPLAKLLALEGDLLPDGREGAPRERGRAAGAALELLPEVAPTCLAHRLGVAGYLAGVWGLPWFFDPRRGTFTTEPFRRGGRGVVAV